MFFPLSKLLGFFALPSNAVVVLGLLGVALLATRWRRVGARLAAASLVLVALLGWSPLGNALLIPLEERFPIVRDPEEVAGIVVLGGSVTPEVAEARGSYMLNEAAERLTETAMLARRYPAARIIHTGGDAAFLLPEGNESVVALRLLEELGIPRERLIAEDRARNTVENAVFSKEIAQPKPGERWLLVTSAYHMPRAVGVFRRAGFPVVPYPVDFRTRGPQDDLRPFSSIGDGLRRTDTAMREWVGLLVYRLTGKTDALFPAPDAR